MPETIIDTSILDNAPAVPENANGAHSKRPEGTRRAAPRRRPAHAQATPGPVLAAQPAAQAQTFASDLSVPEEPQSRSLVTAWPRVLAEQLAHGFRAEDLGIRVTSYLLGPNKSPGKEWAPIDGELVAGGENLSAGEDLYNHVIDFYHRGTSGPAIYKFQVYRKSGGQPLKGGMFEVSLEHPDVIFRQRQAVEDLRRQRSATTLRGYAPAGASYPPRAYPAQAYAPGQPAQASAPVAAPVAAMPAPNLGNPREAELLRELAGENGYYRGLLEGKANQPAPVAPMPVVQQTPAYDPRLPPRGLTEEEWEVIQTQRQARVLGPAVAQAVTQALAALGITPQGIGVGRPGQAVGAPVQPLAAPVGPKSPKEIVKDALDVIRTFRQLGSEVAEEFAPDAAEAVTAAAAAAADDDSVMKPVMGGALKHPGTDMPVLFGQKLEGETWPEYLMRYVAHNPSSGEMVLKYATKVLDPKALSAFVQNLANQKTGPKPGGGNKPPELGGGPPQQMGWAPTG
jgi:hypothetical protein